MKKVEESDFLYDRGTSFYFRRSVPTEARSAFDGRTEWVASLRTRDLNEARRRARIQLAEFERKIRRAMETPPAPVRAGGKRRPAEDRAVANNPNAADPPSAVEWSPELRKSKIYDQLLLDIILGDLLPGGQVNEQALARRYAAGLAGVREALGRLALEGLIHRRPRTGTVVAPLDIVEIRQAFEIRALLEPHCAELAARNATGDDVEALVGAFQDAEAAAHGGDVRALVSMDQRFHAALVRASRNLTLGRILAPLQHKAARLWIYAASEVTPEHRLIQVHKHLAVADCIARRDTDGARAAIVETLGSFPGVVVRALNGGSGLRVEF